MPLKIEKKQHEVEKLATTHTTLGSAQSEQHEVVDKLTFDEPYSTVGFQAGVTRNMGNFNSIRFSINLVTPCKVGEEEATFVKAKEWVENRINKLLEEVEAQ